MRTTRVVIGGALVPAGLVWIAQGLDFAIAPHSFMTADRTWVLIEAATSLAGLVVLSAARRSS